MRFSPGGSSLAPAHNERAKRRRGTGARSQLRGRFGRAALCAVLVAGLLPAVEAGARAVEDADGVSTGATDLGITSVWDSPQLVDDSFGVDDDAVDYYSFTVDSPRLLKVPLESLSSNADPYLEDSQGEVLASSLNTVNDDEQIDVGLAAETYFVRVVAVDQGAMTYRLSAVATEVPEGTEFLGGSDEGTTEPDGGTPPEPDDGGTTGPDGDTTATDAWDAAAETESPPKGEPVDDAIQTRSDHDDTDSEPAGAVDLGDVTALGVLGPMRAGKWNGVLDGRNESIDYYSFTLTADRRVAVALENMSDDADLFVERLEADSSLTVLGSSTNSANTQELLNADLAAGTYYVRVESDSGRRFTYKLKMGTASPRADDPASNFTTTANVEVNSYFEADAGAKIAPYWDIDWVSVELVAGEDYVLEVRGLGAGVGSLTDPDLLGVYVDPNGTLHGAYEAAGRLDAKGAGRLWDNGIHRDHYDPNSPLYDATLAALMDGTPNRKDVDAHDLDDGAGDDAWLLFRAAATGSHYLKVASSGGFEGSYVVAAATAPDAPTEEDPVAAPAVTAAGATGVVATLPPGQGNQLPVLASPVSPVGVDENSRLDVAITAVDPDSEDGAVAVAVVRSIPPGVFSVTPDGRLVSADELDHEAGTHSVTLELTSGTGGRELSVTREIEIDVRDLLEPPSAPNNFQAVATSTTTVALIWEASTTTGPQDITYKASYHEIDSTDPWSAEFDVTELTKSFIELSPGVEYEFRLVAVNDEGASAYVTTTVTTATTPIRPDLLVTPTTLDVGEAGSASFTVRLATQPSATVSVSVAVTSGDTGLVTVSSSPLVFTTTTWVMVQTVTVTGVSDDDAADGSLTVTLSATSTDTDYSGQDETVAVAVADSDTAGLVVNPSSLSIDEDGNGSFTVRLATLPTHSVSVSVGSGDVGAVSVSPTPLVFATQDWGTAQTVTVTGVADVDAWDETVTVSLSATSDDSDYEGETGQVSVLVDDSDMAGLVVNPSSLSIDEDGNGSFTVRLATLPTHSVSVSVGSGDVGAVSVSPTPLVFATQDWGTAQTVTVTGVADVDAWDETVTVTLSAVSDDTGYEGETGQVSVSVDDVDEPGLVVSVLSLDIDEDGSGSFTVRLATQPSVSVSVSVSVSSGDTHAASVLSSLLEFTTLNWATARIVTVTGVSDDDAADESLTVTLSATSTDTDYSGQDETVAVEVADADEAGLVVSATSLSVSEDGSASFTVRLATQPSVSVSVSVGSGDAGALSVSPLSLPFSPTDWSSPKTVTVEGVSDADVSDETVSVTLSAASSDTDYEGLSRSVSVLVDDSDTAGLVVNPSSLSIDEDGNGSFTVRLATLPTHSVSVSVGSGDVGAATVSPTTALEFLTTTWDTTQTVTVAGVSDADAWDETVTVTLSAVSDDTGYEGETGQVSVSVDDDDEPGLVVSMSSLDIDEDGSGSFTVRLATLPSELVSVAVTSGDTGLVTVSSSPLVFTTQNWTMAQTVTVSGVADDDAADGSVMVTLSATSTDTDYSGQDETVAVAVADDDEPGLVVSVSSLEIDEDGSGSFTVRLATQPSVSVSVSVGSNDSGAASVLSSPLVFTTLNWATARIVTVTGVSDDDAADESLTVTLSATSTDTDYEGLDEVGVGVGGRFGRRPGLVVSATSLSVSEDGSASFTVRLATQPSVSVSVSVGSGDAGALSVSPLSLPFSPTDWSSPKTVTVEGVSDADVSDETVSVTLSAASSDTDYEGLSRSVSVLVDDSDTAGLVVNPSSLSIDEDGNGSFTVRLATLPTHSVSVSVGSGDVGAATVSPTPLVFSTY